MSKHEHCSFLFIKTACLAFRTLQLPHSTKANLHNLDGLICPNIRNLCMTTSPLLHQHGSHVFLLSHLFYSSIVIVSLFENYLVTFGHKLPVLLAAFSAKNPCLFSGKILGIKSLTISKQIGLNQLNIGGKWQKRLHPFFQWPLIDFVTEKEDFTNNQGQ